MIDSIIKNIVVIYLVVMSYKTEFSVICFDKLKYSPIGNINPKAPDLMSFWV